jgi:hypothetical protein
MVDQKGGMPDHRRSIDLKIFKENNSLNKDRFADYRLPAEPVVGLTDLPRSAVVFDGLTLAKAQDPIAEIMARLDDQERLAQARLRQSIDAFRTRHGLPAVSGRDETTFIPSDKHDLWRDEQKEARGR